MSYTDVITMTVSDDEGTYQVAMYVDDWTTALFTRAAPTPSAPRPRWSAGSIPASMWPGRNASMKSGAIGMVQGYLRSRIKGGGDLTVNGVWTVEMTASDMDDVKGGTAQPNSLFTRIVRTFDMPAPRTFKFEQPTGGNAVTKVATWIVEGPLMALGDKGDLSSWTESPLGPTPVVATDPTEVEGIELADGTIYVPKSLPNGMTDVGFLRSMRDAGIIVFLHGEPGTGKSRVVEAAFPGHIRKEVDEDTARQDIVGGWLEGPDGNLLWVPGVLQEAMTANDGKGCVLFLDETPLGDSRALAAIYAAIDGRRQLTISENRRDYPTPINAGPDFYVVFAGNLNVPGAVLSEALASRAVAMVEFCTDYDVARKILGPKYDEIVTVAANTETRRQADSMSQAIQMRDLIGYKAIAEVAGVHIALSNLIGKFRSESDRDVLSEILAETLGVSNIPALRF